MRGMGASSLLVIVVSACSSSSAGSDPGPCLADANEPNEAVTAATSLGRIHDDDEVGPSANNAIAKSVRKTFSTTTAADVDWYVLDVLDTGINGNPVLHVLVDAGHEATAFWACSGGTTDFVRCDLGTAVDKDPDLPQAKGCVTAPQSSASPQLTMQIDCGGTSTDSGRLQIRVKRAPSAAKNETDACQRYELVVFAD